MLNRKKKIVRIASAIIIFVIIAIMILSMVVAYL